MNKWHRLIVYEVCVTLASSSQQCCSFIYFTVVFSIQRFLNMQKSLWSHTKFCNFAVIEGSQMLLGIFMCIWTCNKHVKFHVKIRSGYLENGKQLYGILFLLHTVDSGSIRFMWIFARVPWRGGIKQQWDNQKRGYSWLQTLCLRHFRKWGQDYYIVVFSPLSPSHWPQNAWSWMAILHLIFTITDCISVIGLHIYHRAIYRIFLLCDVTSRDVRKRTVKTVICRVLRIHERIADLL